MVTARADFDDRDVFLNTFKKYGVDMDRVHVYRAGNIGLKVPTEEKKKMIIRRVMGQDHYDKVIMYDDAEPNLQAFMSLASEYPWSRFYAWHVDRSGRATEYHRSNIKEATGSSAAGVVLYAEDTGRWGFQQRSDTVNDPGLWAAWGGGREPGESTEQCALRELAEESGYRGPIELEALDENPEFVTFVGRVPAEFEPRYNPEWKDYCWVEAGDWPQPMHPGMAVALENLGQDQTIVEDNVLHLRDWTVTVSPHALERTYQRGINVKAVDRILKNFAQIKSHIAGIEPGQPFIVHDRAGTALGLRRLAGNRLTLATVYSTDPDFQRGRYPTFAVSVSTNESQTAKTGIMQTDVYGSRAYHARCLEPGCDWESRRYDRIRQAQAAAKKHAETHFDKKAVAEAFDQPYKLKWEKSDYGDVDALATLQDGTSLSIMFNLADKLENNWGVEFYRNNSQAATGEGDAQRVFATVLAAIGQFIKKKKPNTLFFTAVKEEDPTGSRAKLYDRLVQRYATGLGYDLKKVDYPEQTGYKLTRKEQGVSEGTNNITYKQQKGKNKFSIEMSVDGKSAGIFQYDADTGRTIVELDPAFRGQGLGQRLILKGIYTAAILGMDYVEDESRTAILDRAMDSLADAGYVVNDDEYWYVTSSGEQFLRQAVTENFADGRNPGRKGLAKRVGVNTKASISSLRKTAKHSSGEKQRMAHWLANMKAGRAKAKSK
jgi:8-oxo-dGTP pyrophosphatase MutT (NUDIX family)/GNAT superfamily N-acetyltransferase